VAAAATAGAADSVLASASAGAGAGAGAIRVMAGAIQVMAGVIQVMVGVIQAMAGVIQVMVGVIQAMAGVIRDTDMAMVITVNTAIIEAGADITAPVPTPLQNTTQGADRIRGYTVERATIHEQGRTAADPI